MEFHEVTYQKELLISSLEVNKHADCTMVQICINEYNTHVTHIKSQVRTPFQ